MRATIAVAPAEALERPPPERRRAPRRTRPPRAPARRSRPPRRARTRAGPGPSPRSPGRRARGRSPRQLVGVEVGVEHADRADDRLRAERRPGRGTRRARSRPPAARGRRRTAIADSSSSAASAGTTSQAASSPGRLRTRPSGAVLVVVEQQDDGAEEVRVVQRRRRHEQPAGERFAASLVTPSCRRRAARNASVAPGSRDLRRGRRDRASAASPCRRRKRCVGKKRAPVRAGRRARGRGWSTGTRTRTRGCARRRASRRSRSSSASARPRVAHRRDPRGGAGRAARAPRARRSTRADARARALRDRRSGRRVRHRHHAASVEMPRAVRGRRRLADLRLVPSVVAAGPRGPCFACLDVRQPLRQTPVHARRPPPARIADRAGSRRAMREIRLALLEADVNFKVVRTFVAAVRERAVGGDVLDEPHAGPAGRQDRRRGADRAARRHEREADVRREAADRDPALRPAGLRQDDVRGQARAPPAGAGASRPRSSPATSTARPPIDQLRDARRAGRRARLRARHRAPIPSRSRAGASSRRRQQGRDVVIVDTAGRLHVDRELMDELVRDPREGLAAAHAARARQHDRPGGRHRRRAVPRGRRLRRRRPDEARRRRARRRGALGARRDRPADPVRRRRREARRARGVPSRPHGLAHPRHGRHALADRARRGAARPGEGRGARAEAPQERVHARRPARPDPPDPQDRLACARSSGCCPASASRCATRRSTRGSSTACRRSSCR